MKGKRMIALALCLLLTAALLSGCGSKFSKENQAAAEAALKAADDYLDGKIDATAAWTIFETSKASVTEKDGAMTAQLLRSYFTNLSTAVLISTQTEGMSYSGGTLLVRRNELARYMEVAERSEK